MAKTLVSQSNLKTIVVREISALTTSYEPSEAINVQGANQLQLLASFTKGSSNGCKIKVEFSEDMVNWYQESSYALSEGGLSAIHYAIEREIENSCDIVIPIPLSSSFMRVSAMAIDIYTGTSLSITATISNI
ncbi:hypothetical protein GF312_02080 [Candidatus Poribacteria bacterium]|nr:hypothetical protein [Candidatus Poribacteria bacterium]